MENDYFSQAFTFLDAYRQQIKPLPEIEPRTDLSARAMLDANRRGGVARPSKP